MMERDFDNEYAPVVDYPFIWITLALAKYLSWYKKLVDAKSELLDENIGRDT